MFRMSKSSIKGPLSPRQQIAKVRLSALTAIQFGLFLKDMVEIKSFDASEDDERVSSILELENTLMKYFVIQLFRFIVVSYFF